MRIRSVFMLSIAMGSAIGVVAALLFALQQWSAFQVASAAQRDTLLLVGALRLPETLNIERAFINPRLVAPASATPGQSAAVQHQTDLVDRALAEANRLATTPADTAALQALQSRLWNVRQGALTAIAQPRPQRSVQVVDSYLPQMFAIQEAAYRFATAVHERINATSPMVGQATRLALLAWDLRDWSGRQTTTLIGYIAQRLPMAGEQAETLAVYKGRIEQKWVASRAFAATLDTPAVMAALTGVERGFWDRGGEAYSTRVVPNRGRTLDLDPDAFVISIRPILDTILPLRDSALDEALRQCDVNITRRRTRFLLALALLLLTAGAAAAAMRWFDRRVVRAVEQITTTILALASGNRSVQVPLQGRTDELGEMATAIETLRRNAIQAEVVGHEILALQIARAEEKSCLLAELTDSNADLARLNLELESLATTDALTGVPNRRSFDIALNREWRRAQREDTPLGLILLDVDYFKAFNDRYGHPAGDVCLARLAAAITSAIRRPADVVARYGGEEFVVVLPSTELAGAAHVAECIRRAVAALNIQHADNPLGIVTVSVGATATYPHAGGFQQALLGTADSALYAAKHAGRNQVVAIPDGAVVSTEATAPHVVTPSTEQADCLFGSHA
jgi:diguanylate cyclase (GGDEF)-like protein